MKNWHTGGCSVFRVCSGEVWEREGDCRKSWACVSLRVCVVMCVCVCVQNPDCQCRTTLQVKQCRIIRDTEGQRGGVREVRKEGDGEKGSKGERWGDTMWESRDCAYRWGKAGEVRSFCRWISNTGGFLTHAHMLIPSVPTRVPPFV